VLVLFLTGKRTAPANLWTNIVRKGRGRQAGRQDMKMRHGRFNRLRTSIVYKLLLASNNTTKYAGETSRVRAPLCLALGRQTVNAV